MLLVGGLILSILHCPHVHLLIKAAILQATVVPCVFFLKGSLTLSLKHRENTSSALVANQMAHVIHWLQRNENDKSLG